MKRLHLLIAVASSVGLSGCFGDSVTVFPPGLEPLEENTAMAPSTAANQFPEDITIITGERPTGLNFGHARGFIHAPIDKVWAALRETDVNADRRATDEWTRMEIVNTDPDISHTYIIETVVHDFITARYQVTWRHGVVEGDLDSPETVAVRWQKTFGLALIEVLEGSITLQKLDDELTEVSIIERLDAPATDEETISQFLRDLFDESVLFSKGLPLPTYAD